MVIYAAYNFSKNKYNCTHYLGEKILRDKDLMQRAKETFEKENQKWKLVEIRSMTTTERTPEHYEAYPEAPEPDKDGKMNAVQFVARHKSGKLVVSAWLFRNDYDTAAFCAKFGLSNCAGRVCGDPVFRRAMVASLESARQKGK